MTSAKGQCSFFKNKIINLNTNINDSVDYEKAVEALGQVETIFTSVRVEPVLWSPALGTGSSS